MRSALFVGVAALEPFELNRSSGVGGLCSDSCEEVAPDSRILEEHSDSETDRCSSDGECDCIDEVLVKERVSLAQLLGCVVSEIIVVWLESVLTHSCLFLCVWYLIIKSNTLLLFYFFSLSFSPSAFGETNNIW